MREWQAAHERIGMNLELGERMAVGFQFHIAKSKEAGMKEAAKYYEENMKMFGELRLVKALTDEQIEAMRDPRLVPNVKLPRIEDAVKAGGFLTGHARRHHRATEGARKSLSGLEPRYRRAAVGVAVVALPGTIGMVREGRHAGVQNGLIVDFRLHA